jgi:hypothetical protein
MKTSQRAALTAAVIAIGALASTRSSAQTSIPSVPVGTMSAYPTIVQTGTKPTLTWNIVYPSQVSDLVQINPPGTLVPLDTTYATVQIVGTDIPPCNVCETVVSATLPGVIKQRIGDAYQQLLYGTWSNEAPFDAGRHQGLFAHIRKLYDKIEDYCADPRLAFGSHRVDDGSLSPYFAPGNADPQKTMLITTDGTSTPVLSPPTDARVSFNGAPYEQIFFGTQADVDPAKKLYIKKLLKNQTLDFGGRYLQTNGMWSQFFTTRSSNLQVIALVNGDIPPTTFSLYRQDFLATYLKPYLDASGRVRIGPLSILIVMELDNSDHANGCFDYQNQILLVTLSSKHPNNGHGNNLDGVDSSNPGLGRGGPNGDVDPSGGVDDEIR